MSYMKSTIGKPVKYGPPDSAKKLGAAERGGGKVVDEVWAIDAQRDAAKHDHPHDPDCWGDYVFLSQLIAWPCGGHAIRLTYYHQRCGSDSWLYGGQTSIESIPSTIKTLLEKTLNKADWFTRQERATD
jgi:hypothetical protein